MKRSGSDGSPRTQGRHLTLPTTLKVAALAATLAAGPVLAQSAGHAGHGSGAPSAASAAASAPAAGTANPKPRAGMAGMDHADMKMQGGSAPPDARDPHAYSGGHTLTTGPYLISKERLLRLGDEQSTGFFLADRLEAQRSDGQTTGAYEVLARYGRDFNRLVVKAEGEVVGGKLEESRTEAVWSRAIATYWDAQVGLRHDTGPGSRRNWIAFGVEGLAPYWFEVDATAYVGESGRTALRLSGEYELLLTQKLILQPRLELAAYGKSDPANGVGKGLSTANAGVRLRYEFTRQFAPYLGVEWTGRFGDTADLARAEGRRTSDTRAVAGLRFWF
ncbi:MAG: copper resistance protein B [Rubrivivax sp.]|nr:copper resistance protein B [Rubrivivax sp.]